MVLGCAPVTAQPSPVVTSVLASPPVPTGVTLGWSPSPRATASLIVIATQPAPAPSAPASTPPHQFFVYFFPVQPPEVCDYSEGTLGHGYPATDIFAPTGTDFVAVTDGIVDFVSSEDRWDALMDGPATRGGLAVAIVGDDGVRYYGSHLSQVETGILAGVRVKGGQLLGKVGSTGDARGRGPHLHFGISSPTLPEDWHARRGEVDPYPYLEAWEVEVYITPRLP